MPAAKYRFVPHPCCGRNSQLAHRPTCYTLAAPLRAERMLAAFRSGRLVTPARLRCVAGAIVRLQTGETRLFARLKAAGRLDLVHALLDAARVCHAALRACDQVRSRTIEAYL